MGRRASIVVLFALASVPAASAEPLPRAPAPASRPSVLACNAADIKTAMNDAAASAGSADATAAARAAFRSRVESCVALRLEWAKTSTSGPTTWFRARTSIGDYFFALWQGGALVGSKPDEAYWVRCDATTMTQTDRNLGRLVCTYGAAPIKPAEFEAFSLSIQTTGPGP
ncbi:MAG TPA: hypothetical protein VIF62_31805 [Labilithrix sp.]|jgi:hypothetical protein